MNERREVVLCQIDEARAGLTLDIVRESLIKMRILYIQYYLGSGRLF